MGLLGYSPAFELFRLAAIAVWITCWIAAANVGARKGMPYVGLILGMLLGPLGLFLVGSINVPAEPRRPAGPPPLPLDAKLEAAQVAADKALRRAGSAIKAGAQRAAAKANEVLNQPPPPPED